MGRKSSSTTEQFLGSHCQDDESSSWQTSAVALSRQLPQRVPLKLGSQAQVKPPSASVRLTASVQVAPFRHGLSCSHGLQRAWSESGAQRSQWTPKNPS